MSALIGVLSASSSQLLNLVREASKFVVGIAWRATSSPILMSSDSGMGRSTGKKTRCDRMKSILGNPLGVS